MNVNLEEVYSDAVRILVLKRKVICDKCEGHGSKKGAEQCHICKGIGTQVKIQNLDGSMIQQCYKCGGQGEHIDPKDLCEHCQGQKVVIERKIFEVYIDKGMVHGQQIVFNGEGNQQPDSEPGDIIIDLHLNEYHQVFKRCGEDLKVRQEMQLVESLWGFQKIIRTLDGRNLVITAISGQVTKHGDVKCILNELMPKNTSAKCLMYKLLNSLI